MMQKINLIYIIGAYDGKEVNYFLNRNYKVIAIDANHEYCDNIRNKFKEYINNRKLVVINKAIAYGNETKFYISKHPDWCSCNIEIANRNQKLKDTITVECVNLQDIINEYGMPYYLRIDIEGNDYIAVDMLKDDKPKYISCESECVGESNKTDEDITRVLNYLINKGYTKFKLVNGASSINTVMNSLFDDNEWQNESSFREMLICKSKPIHDYTFWYDILATY